MIRVRSATSARDVRRGFPVMRQLRPHFDKARFTDAGAAEKREG